MFVQDDHKNPTDSKPFLTSYEFLDKSNDNARMMFNGPRALIKDGKRSKNLPPRDDKKPVWGDDAKGFEYDLGQDLTRFFYNRTIFLIFWPILRLFFYFYFFFLSPIINKSCYLFAKLEDQKTMIEKRIEFLRMSPLDMRGLFNLFDAYIKWNIFGQKSLFLIQNEPKSAFFCVFWSKKSHLMYASKRLKSVSISRRGGGFV